MTSVKVSGSAGTLQEGPALRRWLYAWTMTPRRGQVANGTAFFREGISFKQVWTIDPRDASFALSAQARELGRAPTGGLYSVEA